MQTGDLVRLYNAEWYFEGQITKIEGPVITVDFLDWVVNYQDHELKSKTIHYNQYWVAFNDGEIIKDYR